ncbi:MAG: FAD-dependent oxidoreductase, partial [Halothiobacillus sp.]|nr:FAD-dependent oxidoreductase [Halothiobacillus sp.]
METLKHKPHVVVLGSNFAGLGSAQKIRQYAGDAVEITVVDRKDYLLFVPNIPADVFENRNPAMHQRMELRDVLAHDQINFIQAEVNAIDVDSEVVHITPNERPGAAAVTLSYDYLVVALGNRLAFEDIEGFAEFGDSVSDLYLGEKLRQKLHFGGYKGGPIAIGSARFTQGDGAKGLEPYPGGSIPDALAACEGPPVELMMAAAHYLDETKQGDPSKITVFTPAELIAEDAGETVVKQLLDLATKMGFNYLNNTQDIKRITKDGIEFADGRSVEAELKIVFPNWKAHEFMRGLPISDSEGFVVTDLLMRNPKYKNVFAAGDAAAVTMPKLGAIGHQECEIVGLQIAKDVGRLSPEEADKPLQPVVYCLGDMGGGKAFYIRSNTWFGG